MGRRLEDLFPDQFPDAAPPAPPVRTERESTVRTGGTIGTGVQAVPRPEVTVADLCAYPFAYLSGPAGTGKTFLARQITQERSDALLCATTGIAAVNLGDATTINALLGYFNTQSLLESYAVGWLHTRLRQLRRSGLRILVLDETSMLDADQLTMLCLALDEVNLTKTYDRDTESVTFEADDDLQMTLLLVGDFAQLPPVEAPFAFESREWPRFAEHTFRLDTIRRQGDPTFVQALQAVRKGNAAAALPILESRLVSSLDFEFKGTTIVAKNDEVDRINTLRHAKLHGELLEWKTIRSGEQQKDWLRLIPEVVQVKVGALVMILANRPYPRVDDEPVPGYFYVNGDLATVVGRGINGIRVRLHRTSEEVDVMPVLTEWKEATGKKNPAYTVKGSVTRMPLRLAYATTVHKSQGLSLDEVQVSMVSWMFNKPGMMYVALSRCRTREGLRIVGNAKMFLGKCATDPKIGAFL